MSIDRTDFERCFYNNKLFQVGSLACFVYALISFANKSEIDPDASGAVCLAEQCEVLFPETGKTSEQNKAETVMLVEHRSCHLTTEDNKLLSK